MIRQRLLVKGRSEFLRVEDGCGLGGGGIDLLLNASTFQRQSQRRSHNMRFKFDELKSKKLKEDPRRRIDFIQVQEIWSYYHYIDCRSDDPEQYRAIGWVNGKLYSVIFEIREDNEGEYYHLVTLWKSTKQEEKLYESFK